MEKDYVFTRVCLCLLAIIITIIGAVFIYNILNEVDNVNKYLDTYFHEGTNQGYFNNGSESLLSNIKLGIWIFIFYVTVFWISLISLLTLISKALGDSENYSNEVILTITGIVIVLFGIVTFIFYLSYTDNFKNIEWINNFRLTIGLSFLLFNCLYGFICIAVANIHEKYASSYSYDYYDSDKLTRNSSINTSKETESTPSFCSNCGKAYLSNENIKFCPECDNKY